MSTNIDEILRLISERPVGAEESDRQDGEFTSQEFADHAGCSLSKAGRMLRAAIHARQIGARRGWTLGVVGQRAQSIWYSKVEQ